MELKSGLIKRTTERSGPMPPPTLKTMIREITGTILLTKRMGTTAPGAARLVVAGIDRMPQAETHGATKHRDDIRIAGILHMADIDPGGGIAHALEAKPPVGIGTGGMSDRDPVDFGDGVAVTPSHGGTDFLEGKVLI